MATIAGTSAACQARSVTRPSVSGGSGSTIGPLTRASYTRSARLIVHARSARLRRLSADRRPAARDRRAVRGDQPRRPLPDAARRHRHRQDAHHGAGDRAGAEADAGHRPQQDACRAALQRVPRVLPAQRGRVLRQLLRLLPARGVPAVDRHVHREGLLDQRRHRPAAARGDRGAVRPRATSSSSPRSRASTASARPRATREMVLLPGGRRRAAARGDPVEAGRHPVPAKRRRSWAAASSACAAT